MSYDAITAMLGLDDLADDFLDHNFVDESQPAALPPQQHPADASCAHASPSGSRTEGSAAFTDHTETDSHTDTGLPLDLPSVPAISGTPARTNKTAAAATETEEDLFARLAVLKASTAAPAEDMDTVKDRLAALKGPKISAAELQDLQSRLQDLKGGKNTVSLSELEGRLAQLKGTSSAASGQLGPLEGRPEGELIPDFDPNVDLNQEQLEALANMGDSYADNIPFDKCLAESTQQSQKQQQPPAAMPTSKPKPNIVAGIDSTDLRQVLQDFDPEDKSCISEQQLKAFASMQTRGTTGVPQWAAALGLTAQDLHHDSELEESPKSLSCSSSNSDESSDPLDAPKKGRRGIAGTAARQAQPNRLTKQKLPHQRRH